MTSGTLNLPIDLEFSDPVRRLAAFLGTDKALAVAVRLWSDWGRCGAQWRILAQGVELKADPLARILESYCRWEGEPGELITHCLNSGLLSIEERGSLNGLVLAGFWALNQHLSPGYKTIQQRGGKARALKLKFQEVGNLAVQQAKIFDLQGKAFGADSLGLVSSDPATKEEIQKATDLIMRLDLACDRARRRTEEYTSKLMADALVVVRGFTFEDVDCVCRHLLAHAEDPSLVRETGLILLSFADLLRKSKRL